MKQIQQNSSAENYSAVNLGSLSEIKDYVLEFSPEIKIPGKVFGGQAVGAHLVANFLFRFSLRGRRPGFLHIHKTHEELYFFLSGKGEFQVDGNVFPIEEGSVVRVAPAGCRSVRNNGTEPLVMLCVQYRGNTFTTDDITDGDIIAGPVKW